MVSRVVAVSMMLVVLVSCGGTIPEDCGCIEPTEPTGTSTDS